MKQQKFLALFAMVPLFMIALSIGYTGEADASSGCSGDCSPPTLGVLEAQQIVKGGLTINGQTFDVTYFSQTIPAQSFDRGEQISITLLIYENSGIDKLEHVELVMDVSGADSESGKVSVAWNKKFDGTLTVDVLDYNNMFQDVKAQPKAVDDFQTSMTFLFDHAGPIEINGLKVTVWDYQRNVWNNYFEVAL